MAKHLLGPKAQYGTARRAAVPALLVVSLLGLSACGNRVPRPETANATTTETDATETASPAPGAPLTGPEQAAAAPSAEAAAPGTSVDAVPGSVPAASAPAASAPAAPAAGARPGAGTAAPKAAETAGAEQARAPGTKAGAAPPPAGGAAPAPGASGPAPVPAPGSAPAACSGKENPITIGTVGTQSGVLGEFLRDGPLAIRAWVAATNEKGGLSCHQMKYAVGDDGADPNRHRTLVQQMVENDGVIGFVYMNAPFSGYSAVEYLNQKRVPVIGSEAVSPWFYESPMYFPQASSGSLVIPVGLMSMAQLVGKDKKVALVTCVESAICADMEKQLPQMAPDFGFEMVYQGRGSITQPDYTSHCLGAKQAGADFMALALDGNSAIRVARSCNSVGFKPTFVVWVTAVKTDFDKEPVIDGVVAALSVRPWFDSGHPAIAEFHAALKKHAPGLTPGVPQSYGWSAAKLLEAAGGGGKLPPTATSEDLLKGLWTIKNNDLGGLSSPLTFAEGQPVSKVVCAFPAQVKDGKWKAGTRECLP